MKQTVREGYKMNFYLFIMKNRLTRISSANVLLVLLITNVTNLRSQHIAWANRITGTAIDESRSIKTDGLGCIYVCGSFGASINLDYNNTLANLVSSGGEEAFFAKYDNNSGKLIWAKKIGGANSAVQSKSIYLDNKGFMYITGYYLNVSPDFDPDSGTAYVTNKGSNDIFIAKYDTSGKFIWVRSLGGPDNDQGWGIYAGNSKDIYFTGMFGRDVDFDPSLDTVTLKTFSNGKDIFIARFSSDGDYKWVKKIGGNGTDAGTTIIPGDSGTLYLSGYIEGGIDFDPGPDTANISGFGGVDGFVVKLDTLGKFRWASIIGGNSTENVKQIKTDKAGNLFATGSFTQNLRVTNGPTLYSKGLSDIYLVKYSSNGTLMFAKRFGGRSTDNGDCLAIDKNDNVYLGGNFSDTLFVDTASPATKIISTASWDIFYGKFDNNGNAIWAKTTPGTGGETVHDMDIDKDGNLVMMGAHSGVFHVNDSPALFTFSSKGYDDLFILKCKSDVSSSVSELLYQNEEVHVYPNPASDQITIKCDGDVIRVSIHTLLGAQVKFSEGQDEVKVDVSDLPKGLYLIKVELGKGVAIKRLFID